MKLYAVIFGALVACALSYPLDEGEMVNVYQPDSVYADETGLVRSRDELARPKRSLLLGAGLLGAAALGVGAVGLGGAALGAKAGFIGGALAGGAFRPRSYGGWGYGGYGGYGGHSGYYGGYGSGYYGYGHGYRSYPYVVSDPWC